MSKKEDGSKPKENNNTNEIVNYLKKNCLSRAKAISGGDLSRMFGCNKRELRNKINFLRCQGNPICSGNEGYWYAGSKEDIADTIEYLTAWMKGMNKAVISLRRLLDNQMVLEDY